MDTESYQDEGPTVLACYAHGWETLKACLGRLLLLFIVFAILQAPTNVDLGASGRALIGLYQLFVIGPLTYGLSYAFLVAVRGRDPEVSDLFAPFQRAYLPAVAVSFLLPIVLAISALPMIGALSIVFLAGEPSPILIGLASALVVLPLFALVRLSFIPYLLVEEGLGPIEVLGESWARTRPVQLQILGLEILSLPLLVVGLLLLVVGVIPAMILIGLALATLYDDVSPEAPEDPDEADDPTPTAA